MITTPQPVLDETSAILNEQSTDTSAKRIRLFNRAVRHVLNQYKFNWARIAATLTFTTAQEYNLTTLAANYSPVHGIHEVWSGSTEILPCSYGNRSNQSDERFYLTPDNKSIGFTQTPTVGATRTIWVYEQHTDIAAAGDTLLVPIPESYLTPIGTYIKHLVHEGKRQRYDSRNALLDFQEQMDELVPMEGSRKANKAPRVVPSLMNYSGFKRNYDY